ncbi:hypothetical protein PR048_001237 [Dryococelus australis]|uniref:Uncharacterized protein n=1 Tax=Dryococelus australis TaxID=614101 RepID=A0ABQ9IHG0_9NEOP|nr:hypothetical protein PR048_001237 [Dryococelus australis]
MKSKLIKKYGDCVIIAKDRRKYDNKKKNATEEQLKIVETAAAIIRQDIQSHVYDKTTYPPGDNFLKDVSTCVPTTLRTFLEKVTVNKTKDLEKRKRKCTSTAHSTIISVRPLSMSPILISRRLLLYRKYGSKNLVNILSSLGFCSSYYEVQLLEMATIFHTHPNMNSVSSRSTILTSMSAQSLD